MLNLAQTLLGLTAATATTGTAASTAVAGTGGIIEFAVPMVLMFAVFLLFADPPTAQKG